MIIKDIVFYVRYSLHNLYDLALFLVYPPFCAQCKSFLPQRTIVCDECMAQIQPVATVPFNVTKKWTIPVMAISAYRKPLKRLILAKGWSDITASYELGQLIWQRTNLPNIPIDCFVPIPLHWRRYSWRGYNQAEEIARCLAQKSGKKMIHILTRVKHTKFQSSCSGGHRAENVKDVFNISVKYKDQIAGKHLVVVDDLMTTGATLKSAVRELARLKPTSITAVVACRVI